MNNIDASLNATKIAYFVAKNSGPKSQQTVPNVKHVRNAQFQPNVSSTQLG